MNRKETPQHVTKHNVFEDIGFSETEAAVLAMRVEIALEIKKFVERKQLTQAAAAKLFGVTQPKISNILKGHIEGFTIDYLVRMVSKAGKRPRVKFGRNNRSSQAAA